jgi:DNA-binding transcriptional LysR family regulator
MDIAKLKLFMQVVEQGSLTKVAAMHDTTQPVVSRNISALEAEWGQYLFHRSGRGLTLSEFGTSILPQVERVLAEAARLESEIASNSRVPSGQVHLGILPSMVPALVLRLYQELAERFPEVRLAVHEGYSGQLEEGLASGKLDVAILFHYGAAVPPDQEALADVGAYLVGRPGHPLLAAPQVSFSKLHDAPLVLPAAPNGLRMALNHLARREHVRLRTVMEANAIPVQLAVVKGGGCFTMVSYYAVEQLVRDGALQASLIVEPGIDRAMSLATTTQRPLSLAARQVARTVRTTVDDLMRKGVWSPNAR